MRKLKIHVINTNKVANFMIKLLIPVLPNFMKEGFWFHFNDHQSLINEMGKEILPPHLGGTGPPVDYDAAIERLYKRLGEFSISKSDN